MTQRLNYNISGQVLRHTPGVYRATATWALYDSQRSSGDASRTLDSGSVSADSATELTITSSSGPTQANARRMLVASTAGFTIGTEYEIVGLNGDSERFTLGGLTTNTSLESVTPLVGTYAVGSTIRGVELVTAAILDAVVQDEGRMQLDEPMHIVWTFPSGTPRYFSELVRLVRRDAGDIDIARARADIADIFPDHATRFAQHSRDTLAPHLRIVARQLRAMLLDRHVHAEEWLTGEQGHWAFVWRTLWHLAKLGNAPGGDDRMDPREWADYCKGEFDRYWSALTIGEGGGETVKLEPVNDVTSSTHDHTYRKVFGEL